MQPDHYSFPDTAEGLAFAWNVTLAQRHFGFKTRLAVRQLTRMTRVCTVIAAPPVRPNREARGCNIKRSEPC